MKLQKLLQRSIATRRWIKPTWCSSLPSVNNTHFSTMYYSTSPIATHFPLTGMNSSVIPSPSTPNLSNRVHLSQNQQELLVREQKLIENIINLLKKYDYVSKKDLELLEKSKSQLEDFFLVVCVGEFNAGKSSFLNALLGDKILAEGAIPTTTALHMIKYGGKNKQELDPTQNLVQVELPLAWLKGISLVDTPGTNAVIREHQFITENFVPRSDLILFLTSADRPFSESEKEFMMHIREWGKKVVLVINKFDLMQNEYDQKQVLQFVRNSVVSLLGFEPRIFCVSSKQALLEKRQLQFSKFTETSEETKPEDYNSFEWKDMEDHILSTLNSIERVQLKMENPLGVAENLTKKYLSSIEKRLTILQEDVHTVETIENQLKLYREETAKDFQMHQQKLLNIFLELKNRSQIFFDEFVRWNNIRDLWNPKKVEESFNREVIGNFVVEVERHISEVIDWMIDRKYKQWKMITDFVQKRATKLSQDLYPISDSADSFQQQQQLVVKGDFQFNRRDLILSIGKAAETVITSYNRKEDVDRLNSSIATAINSVGAVSISTIALTSGVAVLSPALLATASLQTAIFGIAGAALSIAMSMSMLGWKRRQNRKKFQAKVDALHSKLKQAVQDKFTFELDQTVESIRSDVSAYVRFVTAENQELESLRKDLEQSKKMISNMRSAIALLATDANASASMAKEATSNLQLSEKEFGTSVNDSTNNTSSSSSFAPGSVFKNLDAELNNK